MRAWRLLAWSVLFAVNATHAATLYKWIDAQGRVQYSDQPPKNFKGEVTRIEQDIAPTPVSAAPQKSPEAAKADTKPAAEKAPPDMATKRRAQREKLAGDVERARARLEAAKAALENGGAPEVDERQVVQQHFAKGTKPGTPRSNCREVTKADGKKSLMCPALVPNEDYYDRIAALEEAIKRAELELEEAERAYRRGAD